MQRRFSTKHKLRVTDIASPLFKTDWPGAPRSPQSETRDQFHANFDAEAQDKLLERCIGLCEDVPDRSHSLLRFLAAWMIRNRIAQQSTRNCRRPRNAALKMA